MAPDIFLHAYLPFPKSLPQFQRLFPDDAACATYLERIRWEHGFVCPLCGNAGEPFRFVARPGVLRCRKCRRDTALTADTVMERTRTPLSTWFWAAYLVASQTAGMSACEFQRQLGLKRYETAFQILHKLRAGMVRPDADKIGKSGSKDHVEVDETWIGGATKGEGAGVHHQTLVIAAIEVRQREPKEGSTAKTRRGGRYAGRLRLQVVENRTAKTLCGFVEGAVQPGSMVVTDGWRAYNGLSDLYEHLAAAEGGEAEVAEEYLPIVHLVFSNLKGWLRGCHHGVSPQHLQAYLNEFTFRFNRRFYPFNAFRSLLGIGGESESPTYRELYSGEWEHPTASGHG
jgi:transposase-like protein